MHGGGSPRLSGGLEQVHRLIRAIEEIVARDTVKAALNAHFAAQNFLLQRHRMLHIGGRHGLLGVIIQNEIAE